MKKQKPIDIILNIFALLIPLILVAFLAFFSYRLIDVRIEDVKNAGMEGYSGGFALTLFATGFVLFFINLGGFVLALVGYLIAKCNKHCKTNIKHSKRYGWLMLAPLANQLLHGIIALVASGIIH